MTSTLACQVHKRAGLTAPCSLAGIRRPRSRLFRTVWAAQDSGKRGNEGTSLADSHGQRASPAASRRQQRRRQQEQTPPFVGQAPTNQTTAYQEHTEGGQLQRRRQLQGHPSPPWPQPLREERVQQLHLVAQQRSHMDTQFPRAGQPQQGLPWQQQHQQQGQQQTQARQLQQQAQRQGPPLPQRQPQHAQQSQQPRQAQRQAQQVQQRSRLQVQQQPQQEQQPRQLQPSQAPQQQGAPRTPGYLVVVEGLNDMRAVRRAAPGASVYVMGTSTAAANPQMMQELAVAAARYRGVIVLTDPDVAGRQARRLLDEALPGCLHAFLPSPLATACAATKHHEEGNVGVEHAAPEYIRAALAAPRRSDPQRQLFTRNQLLQWGLVADMHARGGHVTQRRSLVCAYLGLGDCDGKQLLRQLNRYCFGEEEVQAALQWAEGSLAAGTTGTAATGNRGD